MQTKQLKRDHAIKRGCVFPRESAPLGGRGWLLFDSPLEHMTDQEIIDQLNLNPMMSKTTRIYTDMPRVRRSDRITIVIQDFGYYPFEDNTLPAVS